MFTLGLWLVQSTATAHETNNGVSRQLLFNQPLSNVPDHNFTAITVQLDPGNISPAHTHEAFVFVHVLTGKVRSQLNSAKPIDYVTGDSWIEPPGSVHTLTQNLNDKEIAKLLVIFVSKDGSKLTTSGTISQ